MALCEPMDARVTASQDPETRSDLELVAAINDGDVAAFESLYFRYRNWVATLAFRLTGDNDAALDVLQETFLYVLKKFPGFRLTANFKTFLYPAVRNLSIAARRKAKRYHASEEDLTQLENVATPPQVAAASGDLELILDALSDNHREVVLLRFVDDLSLSEIAEATQIPLGTVKSRLHNALQILRSDERTRKYFQQ